MHHVGTVLIVGAIAGSVAATLSGKATELFGRKAVFVASLICVGVVVARLFTWTPNPEYAYEFYLYGALFGMGERVIITQLTGKNYS